MDLMTNVTSVPVQPPGATSAAEILPPYPTSTSFYTSSIGHRPPPFPLHITQFAIGNFLGGLIVCIENVIVVAVSLRSSNLRGNCNILIGVLALMDLISGVCFIQQGLQILMGYVIFPQRVCALIWSTLFFSLDTGSALILAVGFDRYASLMYPIWYKNLRRGPYLIVVFASSLMYGISVPLMVLGGNWVEPRKVNPEVVCIPPTALSGFPFHYWIGSNLIINISVVFIYILAFRRAKELHDAEIRGNLNREISRKTAQKHNLMVSLVIVVYVYMCSWLATIFILGISSILPISASTRFHIHAYSGWLVLVNIGSNCLIYYFRSELYHTEILRLLIRPIFGGFGFGTGSEPASPTQKLMTTEQDSVIAPLVVNNSPQPFAHNHNHNHVHCHNNYNNNINKSGYGTTEILDPQGNPLKLTVNYAEPTNSYHLTVSP